MTNPQLPQTSIKTAEQTALAERREVQAWTDPDWQRLWLTLDRSPWRTLALIPGSSGGPADLTLTLAVTLSRTGMSHVGAPILVADGTQIPLNQLNGFLDDVRACRDGGERVIIALSAAAENPTTTAIAKAADAVVLCVQIGRTRSSDAKRTIKQVGLSKFVGSLITPSLRRQARHAVVARGVRASWYDSSGRFATNYPMSSTASFLSRMWRVAVQDVEPVLSRQILVNLADTLPSSAFFRTRTAMLRAAGVQIGEHSLIQGKVRVTGPGNPCSLLSIGEKSLVTGGLHVDLGAPVSIGDMVRSVTMCRC